MAPPLPCRAAGSPRKTRVSGVPARGASGTPRRRTVAVAISNPLRGSRHSTELHDDLVLARGQQRSERRRRQPRPPLRYGFGSRSKGTAVPLTGTAVGPWPTRATRQTTLARRPAASTSARRPSSALGITRSNTSADLPLRRPRKHSWIRRSVWRTLTRPSGPPERPRRWGKGTSGLKGTFRSASDNGCSVYDSSLSWLSAELHADGLRQRDHRPGGAVR